MALFNCLYENCGAIALGIFFLSSRHNCNWTVYNMMLSLPSLQSFDWPKINAPLKKLIVSRKTGKAKKEVYGCGERGHG